MNSVKLGDKIFRKYIDRTALAKLKDNAVRRVYDIISESLEVKQRECIVVSVMTGAMYFACDITKEIDLRYEVSSIKLSSYVGTESSGCVKVSNDIYDLIKSSNGKTVIIIEDILDTGVTIRRLVSQMSASGVSGIHVISLFGREDTWDSISNDLSRWNTSAWCSKKLGVSDFIVGYGLDYNGLGRNYGSIYKMT